MQFVDEVVIRVKAGDGGNGVDVAGLFGPDAQFHISLPPGWLLAPL